MQPGGPNESRGPSAEVVAAQPIAYPRPRVDAVVREDIVFVGDVHLGRRPVGLDSALSRLGHAASGFSPAVALARTVDAALADPPRAVVFAGDLVDHENDRFEALGILEREVRRLVAAEIPVFAIAGNHDCLVLPRLVERVEGVRLIGAAGTWERIELPGPGRPVDLFGWSFPTSHVRACPLDQGDFEGARAGARPGATLLGVLHADLDVASSPYAPVPRRRLADAGLDGWFLGHVHAPGDLADPAGGVPIGYLGSLVGLDPGETGPRGPWRVGFDGGGVSARQLSLGPVRWEQLAVALSQEQAADPYTIHARLKDELETVLGADATLVGHELVVVRVTLIGELPDRGGVRQFVSTHASELLDFQVEGLVVVVQRVTDATREPVDLDLLATEPTPVGRVASHLVALRDGQAAELIAQAGATAARVDTGGWELDPEDHPLPAATELLERAAWRLLGSLLDQRREATS